MDEIATECTSSESTKKKKEKMVRKLVSPNRTGLLRDGGPFVTIPNDLKSL